MDLMRQVFQVDDNELFLAVLLANVIQAFSAMADSESLICLYGRQT